MLFCSALGLLDVGGCGIVGCGVEGDSIISGNRNDEMLWQL